VTLSLLLRSVPGRLGNADLSQGFRSRPSLFSISSLEEALSVTTGLGAFAPA
jgi:hypothetical protein